MHHLFLGNVRQDAKHFHDGARLLTILNTADANSKTTIESLPAAETANFLRLQIVQRPSVARLTQANQQRPLALTLLGVTGQ